jgi:phthiocerol/phenolphthiocerol synthesis type-I polyketide synthase E
VGFIDTIYPVALSCSTAARAGELLDGVQETGRAVPHHGIGYGLLRYLHAPTSRLLLAYPSADIFFCDVGTVAEPALAEDAPVQLAVDTVTPARETLPGLGHALELRTYRCDGVLHLDWWYDTRRLEPAVVESLAQGLPGALTDLVDDLLAEAGIETAGDELELIDLSTMAIGGELHA